MTFELYCDVSSPLLWNYLTLNWWTSWLRYRQALPAINESWIKKTNKQTRTCKTGESGRPLIGVTGWINKVLYRASKVFSDLQFKGVNTSPDSNTD